MWNIPWLELKSLHHVTKGAIKTNPLLLRKSKFVLMHRVILRCLSDCLVQYILYTNSAEQYNYFIYTIRMNQEYALLQYTLDSFEYHNMLAIPCTLLIELRSQSEAPIQHKDVISPPYYTYNMFPCITNYLHGIFSTCNEYPLGGIQNIYMEKSYLFMEIYT